MAAEAVAVAVLVDISTRSVYDSSVDTEGWLSSTLATLKISAVIGGDGADGAAHATQLSVSCGKVSCKYRSNAYVPQAMQESATSRARTRVTHEEEFCWASRVAPVPAEGLALSRRTA